MASGAFGAVLSTFLALAACEPSPRVPARAPVVDWPPVVMRCLQMGDSCGGSAATCRGLASLDDDASDEAMSCFDASTCDAYAACFRTFLASHAVRRASADPRDPPK